MPATMCDLATKLPLLIGGLLDRESKLKKGRFREETMTDILTGALAAFAGPNLVIEYPPEAATGGDIDLRFWHVADAEEVHVRLQAKRLNAEMDGKRKRKVQHRSYEHLLHKPNSTAPYQFRTLKSAPSPWVPLYIFYNHLSVVNDLHFKGTTPTVSGVNLAFAQDIAKQLELKVAGATATEKKILHHQRLSHLQKNFFSLDAILCPSGDWKGEQVPSPSLVAASLSERYGEFIKINELDDSEAVLRILSRPGRLQVARNAPRRLGNGPAVRVNQALERTVVTLISGRTDAAPTITDGPT